MKQILLFILWISIGAFAQDGNIDTAFNTLDTGKGDGFGSNSVISKAIIQDDGKMIVVGNFMRYNGVSLNRIVRLNIDGSIDTSFNSGTGPDIRVTEIAIQDDGKIIIAGFFFKYNGIASHNLARLNTDGTLDTSFNIGSSVNGLGAIADIVIQDDGKIIIVGTFTSYNGISSNKIARLNTDGTLDTSFNSGGTGPNSGINKAAIQNDGKIIIVGDFTSYNGISSNKIIARLNTDGTLDTSFNSSTGVNGIVRTIAIQNDGKIIIVGDFTSYNGIIARLNTDGTLDTSFNSGTGVNGIVRTIAIQEDGNIILGGEFTSYNNIRKNRIIRVLSSSVLHISDNEIDNDNIKVFPNPVKDILNINLYKGLELNRINVYNTLGQLISSSKKEKIDTSSLKRGIYFVEVLTNQGKFTKKILVE